MFVIEEKEPVEAVRGEAGEMLVGVALAEEKGVVCWG